MVNQAMDQAARQRLVSNVVGHARQDVTEPVLSRLSPTGAVSIGLSGTRWQRASGRGLRAVGLGRQAREKA